MRDVRAALAFCAALLLALPGYAEPVQLKFGYPGPLTAWPYTKGFGPWAQEVERDAPGLVEIKVYPGGAIATFRNAYDRTINGVADMTFGTFGDTPGQFPRTEVSNLPFEADNGTAASIALWKLYQGGVIAPEYGSVKPLVIFTFPSSIVHATKEIKTAADMQGLKFAVSGRIAAEAVTRLGGAPVTMSQTELYPALQRGMVQASNTSWPGAMAWKLEEVTKYHLEVPFGLAPGFILMNKDSFARLPEPARGAIDRHSGAALSLRMGKAADETNVEGKAKFIAMGGHVVAALDPAETARWKQALAPITGEWIKTVPDGTAVLAAFRAELVNARRAQ